MDNQAVIDYLTEWHGDCSDCEIKTALQRFQSEKNYPFTAVLDAADESDPEWRESFNFKQALKHKTK